LPIASIIMRRAEAREASLVRAIDDAVFPEHSEDLQRAAVGELEEGIASKDVCLFEIAERTVAYLHLDRSAPGSVSISGLAILPEMQNRGLGTALAALARPILEEYEHKVPIYTVTSPRNRGCCASCSACASQLDGCCQTIGGLGGTGSGASYCAGAAACWSQPRPSCSGSTTSTSWPALLVRGG
jgi:GNAT superfamily N-acetyltransferase